METPYSTAPGNRIPLFTFPILAAADHWITGGLTDSLRGCVYMPGRMFRPVNGTKWSAMLHLMAWPSGQPSSVDVTVEQN